jgi:uncharacterized membrane protein YbhN (UPF0104 family)
LLPLGISGFLLWLLTRGLSWQRIADSLAGAPPWLLAAYALLTLAGLFLRAVRFRLLLPAPRPATAPLALATLVQNCLGDLVPARLASLGSYVFILSRRLSVAPAVSAATFILSFALDLATLGPVLLLATAIRAGQLSPAFREHVPTGWVVAAALLLLGVACLIVLRFGAIVRSSGRVLTAVVAVLGMRDAPSIGAATEGLEKAAAALDRIDTARAFAGAFSLSLLIRMAKYVALMALMHGILQGAGGVDRVPSFWDLVIGVSVTEGLAALPLPTLGQFGVWEGGMIGVLVLLGLPREPATIAAVAIHAVTQGFEFLLGMIALGLILLLYRRPAASSPDSPAA